MDKDTQRSDTFGTDLVSLHQDANVISYCSNQLCMRNDIFPGYNFDVSLAFFSYQACIKIYFIIESITFLNMKSKTCVYIFGFSLTK